MSIAIEDVAEHIEAALTAEDLDQLAPLLADDVRWGDDDEDAESTCHNRADVLAWFEGLRRAGVQAHHIETLVQPGAVIIGWNLSWPPDWDEQPPVRYQVFCVADGLVSEIRGFPDSEEALAFVSGRREE